MSQNETDWGRMLIKQAEQQGLTVELTDALGRNLYSFIPNQLSRSEIIDGLNTAVETQYGSENSELEEVLSSSDNLADAIIQLEEQHVYAHVKGLWVGHDPLKQDATFYDPYMLAPMPDGTTWTAIPNEPEYEYAGCASGCVFDWPTITWDADGMPAYELKAQHIDGPDISAYIDFISTLSDLVDNMTADIQNS